MRAPDFHHWLEFPPYSLNSAQKRKLMLSAMRQLTEWHASKCESYRQIIRALQVAPDYLKRIEDVPCLPVRLFKEFELLSVPRDAIFKTMTSSGTSGQQASKIFLDRETASFQIKVLSRVMTELMGKKRLPMLVLDSPSVLKDRLAFSARGAGILGFSMFGMDVTYALKDDMKIDIRAVESFLARHADGPILLFGFTSIIWQYFAKPLLKSGSSVPLDRGVLFHGGGWKKLSDQNVDNGKFKQVLRELAGLTHVINYYGMVEQTGSIYIECEEGYLHPPVYSDVLVRRADDFAMTENGEEGIIEVLSILPRSYPGHALLTEDRGTIFGEDDCPCGRLGKYFHVHGRLAQAEVRGCSDTHEAAG